MGSIKDRKGRNLTEAEDIRRGGKNTRRTVQKRYQDPDNHDSVITHLEPDIRNVQSNGP